MQVFQTGPAHRRGGSVCGLFHAKSGNASISRQGQHTGEVGVFVGFLMQSQ